MANEKTLYDHRQESDWWRQLGWREADLRRVLVHEFANPDDTFLTLPDTFGPAGRSLYVYKGEMPDELWERLSAYLSQRDQAGGYDIKEGLFSGTQKRMTDWDE